MSYQVPEHIDKKKIFLVNKAKIQERFDAIYHKERFDFTGFVRLGSVVSIKGGKRIPKGMDYCNNETSHQYLRVSDIMDDSFVDFKQLKFIDDKVYNILKRYQLNEGDITVSIAGTIGKVYLAKHLPINKNIILTENCAKLVVGNNSVLPEYIAIMLQMPILQKQMELNYIQTTIPKIGLDRIGKLMIPKIPNNNIQNKIIDQYNSIINNKKQKNKESQQLIDGIENYLLNKLGIKLPTISNSINNRVFKTSFRGIAGGRMDPVKVLYLGDKAKSEKFPNIQLRRIASIVKGQAITSDEIIDGPYPVIAGGQTSPYCHNIFNHNGNVITVSASGAYSGFVWYHDEPIFASDCSVIKSYDENRFRTKYIFEVLKAQQKHIYLLQQGAGQPHVYPSDLGELWIPEIDIQQQDEIITEIQAIRDKAASLRKEAEEGFDKAKKEVEKQIMGE